MFKTIIAKLERLFIPHKVTKEFQWEYVNSVPYCSSVKVECTCGKRMELSIREYNAIWWDTDPSDAQVMKLAKTRLSNHLHKYGH